MTTTLDIPDDLAALVERQAQQSGRATAEQLLHLLRLAMLVEELPLMERARLADVVRVLVDARNRAVHGLTAPATDILPVAAVLPDPVLTTDRVTGLPVIFSPPDAPIHRMRADEFQAVIDQANEEAELERAGIPF